MPESGDFELSWIGHDGTRQVLRWVPPNKVSVVVMADASFDPASQVYTYSYGFSNLPSSAQHLRTIYLEGWAIEGQPTLDGEGWYSRGLTPFLREQLAVSAGWAWSHTAEPVGVPPGGAVSGFKVRSRHPPGIVRVYAAGVTPTLKSMEEPPDELHEAIDNAYFRIPRGFTIGPVEVVPGDEIAGELSDLLSDLDEAGRQGWLGSSESASTLQSSLQAIRSSVVDGDMDGARDRIHATIGDLNGPEHDRLLSEARALLEHRLRRIRNAGGRP